MRLSHNVNMELTKERLDWLDVLKCLVMWLVVIGHANPVSTNDSYRFYLYSFHMPLFFMISGASFYFQERKRKFRLEGLIRNKIKALIWPYITLNIIAIPIWILNFKVLRNSSTSLGDILFGIIYSHEDVVSSPTNATWFIVTLFLTNILFFLIYKYAYTNEKYILLSATVICSFGYSISINDSNFIPPWHLETVPIALLFFTIGFVVIQHKEKLISLLGNRARQLAYIIILFPIAFCCAHFNSKISMSANHYGSFILFVGAVIGFSIICLIIALNMPNISLFRFIGRNTIVILALHSPILRFLMHFSETTATLKETHPIITGTIVFIAMIPVCYIFERWLPFLIGRKKKKNTKKASA